MRPTLPPLPLTRKLTAQERLDRERHEREFMTAEYQQENRIRSTALDRRARAEEHRRQAARRLARRNRRALRSNPRDWRESTSPTGPQIPRSPRPTTVSPPRT